MRSIINVLLLFLIFLSNEAQGIRLKNWMMKPIGQLEKALIEEESLVVQEGCGKINLSINENANSGNNRKLMSTATSPSSSSPTPSTTSRIEEERNKKENSKAISSENVETLENEHYQNLIDIAEMDYSPATRKPPIHN